MDTNALERTVFLSNVPDLVTEKMLGSALGVVGPVIAVSLNRDKETGKLTGSGICEFADEASAVAAKRTFDGFRIYNNTFRVDLVDRRVGVTKRPREETTVDLDMCTTTELGEIFYALEKRQGPPGPGDDRNAMMKHVCQLLSGRTAKRARYLAIQEKLNAITTAEEADLEPDLQGHLKKAREACDAFLS